MRVYILQPGRNYICKQKNMQTKQAKNSPEIGHLNKKYRIFKKTNFSLFSDFWF